MKVPFGRFLLCAHRGAGRPRRPARSLLSLPLVSLGLGATALIVRALPQGADLLQYDRAAIAGGEVWRVVTGHWTHWNMEHLLWDLVVFVVLGAVCERTGRRDFILALLGGSLLISLAVWSLHPRMEFYRGLSGLDATLYVVAAAALMRTSLWGNHGHKLLFGGLLFSAFFAKTGYELLLGQTIFVQDMGVFVPVPMAHIAGAAAGGAVALLSRERFSPVTQSGAMQYTPKFPPFARPPA